MIYTKEELEVVQVAAHALYSDWENEGGPSPDNRDFVRVCMISVATHRHEPVAGVNVDEIDAIADVVYRMSEWGCQLDTLVVFTMQAMS